MSRSRFVCSYRVLPTIVAVSAYATAALGSECYDHYNHSAWSDTGIALVLCSNNSDATLSSYITACELRHHGGAKIQSLVRHGSLDKGRLVYADYDTTGASFNFDIDVVCVDKGGSTHTFALGNGNTWHDGCCRHKPSGPVACCGPGGSPEDAGSPDATLPTPDGGDTGAGSTCLEFKSAEFAAGQQLLDVAQGNPKRIAFTIAGVPDPIEIDFAELFMRLHDADHPGKEGTVYVNGSGPIPLPANSSWDNQTQDVTLPIPKSWLRAGENVIEFGAGSLSATHYSVGRVALSVGGSVCLDAAAPQDANGGSGGQALPDAGFGGGAGRVPTAGSAGGVSRGAAEEGDSSCACSTPASPSPRGPWIGFACLIGVSLTWRRARRRNQRTPNWLSQSRGKDAQIGEIEDSLRDS